MHVIASQDLVVELNERCGGEVTSIKYAGREILASYDWASPIGARQSTTYGDPKLDWLSEYRGGWQLLVPNAGAACEVGGVPLPFHGEWSRTVTEVELRGVDRVVFSAGTRLPLVVQREVFIATDPQRVLVTTIVKNTAQYSVDFIWGEHPAFSVGQGDTIDFPNAQVFSSDGDFLGQWPECRQAHILNRVDTTGPAASVHFLVGFNQGWAALRRGSYGVALAWDIADFPYAWLWHEIASPDFPFYGRASLVAIEPASSWPGRGLAAAVTSGQAFRLEPNELRSTVVALIPFIDNGDAVTHASIDGLVTRASRQS